MNTILKENILPIFLWVNKIDWGCLEVETKQWLQR